MSRAAHGISLTCLTGLFVGYNVKDNSYKKNCTLDYVLPVVVKSLDRHTLIDNAEEDSSYYNAANSTASAVC